MRHIVLLSSFNGREYIGEQLTSILNQLPIDGRVLIRDDGSCDGTPDLIAAINDERISLIRGSNVGFCRSFFALLDAAPDENAAYFFADQDDVWLPGKLLRATNVLASHQREVFLYCSRAQLVDESLAPAGHTPHFTKAVQLLHALTENIATGCTVAFTQPLLRMMKETRHREFIAFHDWWAYVIATKFGDVYFDPVPTVLYRQHSGNAIGMRSGLARYVSIFRYLRRHNWLEIMNRQVWALRQNYWKDLTVDQRRAISTIQGECGEIRRCAMIASRHSLRSRGVSDLLLRALTLMDRRPADVLYDA